MSEETPPTPHTQLTFKTMTELNIQAQIIELSDDQLELVEGGSVVRVGYEVERSHKFLANLWRL